MDVSTGTDRLSGEGRSFSVPSSHTITAAAFDGDVLAVADQAYVTSYDANLTLQQTLPVQTSCISGALIVGHRFVCAPPAYASFTVFDFASGSVTQNPTSAEQPMAEALTLRVVPGLNELVSPNYGRFVSYAFTPDGTISTIGSNGYGVNGRVPTSAWFAFDANPATHVIDEWGDLMKLDAPGCTPPGTSAGYGTCLQIDGHLGDLTADETFVAMADDGAGTLFGIVASMEQLGPCSQGCTVERIDIPSQTVVRRSAYVNVGGSFVGAKYDPYAHAFLYGYNTPPGYSIDAITP